MPADPYGLSRAQLLGCLRAFYRNRHKRIARFNSGRRADQTGSAHRCYRQTVAHYVARIRFVDQEV